MTGVHRSTYGAGNAIHQDAGARKGRPMAGNDNEIFGDVTLESDDSDTEGHRLATNDNDVIVERLRRVNPDDSGEMDPLGARRR